MTSEGSILTWYNSTLQFGIFFLDVNIIQIFAINILNVK